MDDLQAVERRLLEALQRGDMSATADLLSDDFLITTAGWLTEPVGKDAWLNALDGRMTLERFDLRVLSARRFGDVAVVLAESTQDGTHDGKRYSMTFRYTDVWLLKDGDWRLTTRHASSAR